MLRIVVDSREASTAKYIFESLRKRFYGVEVGKLECGDYLIEGCENFLVERSTQADFIRKIKDATLWEQLRALLSVENVTPLLLIERSRVVSEMNPAAVHAAILSVMLDWGVKVVFSMSKTDTVAVLSRLCARAEASGKKSEKPIFKPKAESEEEEVLRVVANLPGVGVSKAKKLLERFKTIQRLANAEKEEIMQVEGFGEKSAEKIYEVFRREFKS